MGESIVIQQRDMKTHIHTRTYRHISVTREFHFSLSPSPLPALSLSLSLPHSQALALVIRGLQITSETVGASCSSVFSVTSPLQSQRHGRRAFWPTGDSTFPSISASPQFISLLSWLCLCSRLIQLLKLNSRKTTQPPEWKGASRFACLLQVKEELFFNNAGLVILREETVEWV